MSKNRQASVKRGDVGTDLDLSGSYSLVHDLRNYRLPTRDELYLTDRDAYYNGEEGIDFAFETASSVQLCPKGAALAAQKSSGSKQQQQNIKSADVLELQFRQQQMQQRQM